MHDSIPNQQTGKSLDCFRSIQMPNEAEANTFFDRAKAELLDVNNWHEVTGTPSAVFEIIAGPGAKETRPVQPNDHIRIDIPGPGLPSANGYDWVRVEDIVEGEEKDHRSVALTLRPASDPTQDNDDTAHFFKQMATSTLLIEQSKANILISYAGRNEVINTSNSSTLDNLRNFMVGIAAKMGASFPQWRALINGLGNSVPTK